MPAETLWATSASLWMNVETDRVALELSRTPSAALPHLTEM
jgi:hypothetical protein